MSDPWRIMTLEDGRAMDRRKEHGPNRFFTRVHREVLWRLIRQHLSEDPVDPILDLGGGTGVWSIRLAEVGRRVVLTDVSPGLLACAREKVEAAHLSDRVRIVWADMVDLGDWSDASFPLVLALGDPLSYCDDAERALREALRVTRPGGVLIGDVENRYRTALSERRARIWTDARRILTGGVARWPEPEHAAAIRTFTPSELREVLTTAGWVVRKMYPSGAVASSVSPAVFQAACESDAGLTEVIALEERLREDASLLGAGLDLLFVARKPTC